VKRKSGRGPDYELYLTDGTSSNQALRNFHSVTCGLPLSAVCQLGIVGILPEDEADCLKVGNIVRLTNVRVKEYQGQLELVLQNRISEAQQTQGFRNKARHIWALDENDPKAREVEACVSLMSSCQLG